MRRLMVCTVGIGPNVANSIRVSVDEFGPTHVVLLTSKTGEQQDLREVLEIFFEPETAESYLGSLEGDESGPEREADREQYAGVVVEVPFRPEFAAFDDAETLTLAYRREILAQLEEGTQATLADFTGGTRPMSAALFSAASSLGFDRINYMTGERDDEGLVIPGTEQTRVVYGRKLRAADELREATRLFNAGEYPAAREKADRAREAPEPNLPLEGRGFRLVAAAAEGYAAWDRFQFDVALEAFDRLRDDDYVDSSFVGEAFVSGRRIDRMKRHLYEAGEASDDAEIDYVGLAADLLENARRRIGEDAWDDALGRLYRATEYLGQLRIHARFDAPTDAFPVERLPDELREDWNPSSETLTLGLDRSWRLLEAVGDDFGEMFAELYEQGGQTAIQQRNHSILAHGFEPVRPKYVEVLAEIVDTLGGQASDHWSDLKSTCEFREIEQFDV